MKNCFCSVNNFLNWYKTYNDLDLNLRAEVHVNFNTTIVGWSTFLNTTSHNICNSDTRYADPVHGLHKLIQFVLAGDDNNFCQFVYAVSRNLRNRFSRSRRSMFYNRIFYGSSHWSRSLCHSILYKESIVCTCKAVLFHIQTCNLFLSGNTKADGVFDYLENNCHCNSNPCDGDGHTDELNTEAMETAACEKTFPFCTSTV